MKSNIKALLITVPVLLFSLISTHTLVAQKAKVPTETPGCKPSSCRGAQTKFGEAKVISEVRADLIALKADMEKSVIPSFNERSYDIHNIIGESDEESIAIIVKEVKLIEAEFTIKLDSVFDEFTLPSSKAKQVKYLTGRIQQLQNLL